MPALLSALLRDRPLFALMVLALTGGTMAHILLIDFAQQIDQPAFLFGPLVGVLVIAYGAALVIATWWHAALWLERQDENIRGWRRRWVPMRRHSWWGLLGALVMLAPAAGGLFLIVWLASEVGWDATTTVCIIVGMAIGGYTALVHWIQRWIFGLWRGAWGRGIRAGLELWATAGPWWCLMAGLSTVLPDIYQQIGTTLGTDAPTSRPTGWGAGEAATAIAMLLGVALPYTLTLTVTWALMWRALARSLPPARTLDEQYRLRRMGRQSVAEMFT